MIVLFTDFGNGDPYVGQMHAAIRRHVDAPIIDLLHDAPSYDVRSGAYLLDALQNRFSSGDVFVCVVDPGVGGDRAPVMVMADGKWYIGPDNGLLNVVCGRARSARVLRIDWRPPNLSSSFHGRDLFAPVAARLYGGTVPAHTPWSLIETRTWPEELQEIIYIDHYGNAMTGIRADSVGANAILTVKDTRLAFARTFSSVAPSQPFWYRNSLDLIEIAARKESAAALLSLEVGEAVSVTDYDDLLADTGPHIAPRRP